MRGVAIVATLAALLALAGAEKVCIVGSGIGGSAVSYFLQNHSVKPIDVEIYEKRNRVGGRLDRIQIGDDYFEAGGSIIAEKNMHMQNFVELLGLKKVDTSDDDSSLGIWNGRGFIFQTVRSGDSYVTKMVTSLWNTLLLLWRYGTSLMTMQSHVSGMMENWMKLYDEDIPVFETAESMLKFIGLYEPTQHTLEEDLVAKGLSRLLIDELITVIMRINYGQNVSISGLAGSVSLAGSGDDLWAVEGGNFQVPAGLIKISNASLYLNQEVVSVEYVEGTYKLGLASNERKDCDAVVIATPLDEVSISFTPKLKLPARSMQHTITTFVRGLINPIYFGAKTALDLPVLIGTIEDPALPFSSVSILKSYSAEDNVYKMFSRLTPSTVLLDQIFSKRTFTRIIDWAAYPHYEAPEQFAPILLDGHHLYYVNTFESAASAMEASAVAAKNVARLLLSRTSGGILSQVVRKSDLDEAAEL
ncbi:prenylcysteine oxidase / farnesylcysteine lyase [Marchantia polymorpha subsp. ruderalis]|uniref:Prenylcysteine lyase domain-containing protein n=2 Tax=Marchantia polymorpha TaxID=3197 RepID=A0A176WMJ2_MARPO|nr:hypothetical protein AXG93_1054s1460 [Marchantia polymorpha subsp. ruderalis]PTQ41901.1 hypothetical protein MARPO_0032s0088 [Marchantia polymorpha]BBN11687.1 hypothetical protein Mp_5g13980 [Marchantia polymorpha subsp. ruderalis]|eukprot:PTQ41901.1 hypothetical protein MARPO_0032s0088 [Marchantia polymorpha]